jgi:capsid protein
MAIFGGNGRSTLIGFALGVGATVLARQFLPALKEVGRPLAKATIKSGIATYEKARETIAEIGEAVDDLVAEAVSELAEEEANKAADYASSVSPESNGGQ